MIMEKIISQILYMILLTKLQDQHSLHNPHLNLSHLSYYICYIHPILLLLQYLNIYHNQN
jgi:hypothetical protein